MTSTALASITSVTLPEVPRTVGTKPDHLAGMQLKVLTQLGHRLVLTQGGQCHPCLERRTVGAPGTAR